MRIFGVVVAVCVLAFGGWWISSAPPEINKVGGPIELEAVPDSIAAVASKEDFIAKYSYQSAPALPPYDEVILNKDETLAYIPTKDGWFWKVDLKSGNASPFVKVPLMAAGARQAPDDQNLIYFCASYLYGKDYPETERVGLYQLNVETRAVTPLVLDVPLTAEPGGRAKVYAAKSAPTLKNADASTSNSRPLTFCNDLDVSADGKRIYFTEPFTHGRPAMGGGGTYREAITLGQNGLIWRYDLDAGETSVVAQNFIFPDGILVENIEGAREESILVTETVRFRLVRLFMGGAKAGQYEEVWDNLPGMPDGMDRDSQGRIWIGILKQRSGTIDLIHRNPWIKPFLLRLPASLMPVSRKTSFLALSADASKALYYTEHDGSVVSDISVVVPGRKELYLAVFNDESRGLHRVRYPTALEPTSK